MSERLRKVAAQFPRCALYCSENNPTSLAMESTTLAVLRSGTQKVLRHSWRFRRPFTGH